MRLGLLPKNGPFFSLFVEQSGVLQNASRLLGEESRIYDQNVCDHASRVLELEHRGDALIREILTRLDSRRSTPLEPDDVRQITSRRDDALDGVEEVAGCALLINDAVKALGGNGGVLHRCGEIDQLEREADTRARSGLTELPQANSYTITIIKLKKI